MLPTIETLLAITLVLSALGVVELAIHRRRLRRIPIRVHVNGTRGKSSVVRLIAAGLREAGIVTCAKTTGTMARMILPDGHEVPIFRPAGANIIEQKRVVAVAEAHGAQALVLECMALQPGLQALSELMLISATHGVITNARPDHLDVMGPEERDVARALAGTVPRGGKLFTTERSHLDVLKTAAGDRRCELIEANREDLVGDVIGESEQERESAITEVLDGFHHTEHADNVALALAVCRDLGVAQDVALRGMYRANPDPGAMTERHLDFFGRRITFVNGFAANDPVSTAQLWHLAARRYASLERRIAVFNCRADRPDRSLQLGRECAGWEPADHVVLMGSGTYLFARAAASSGLDPSKLIFVEGLGVERVFERIVALVGESALVMGMGNVGRHGLELAMLFNNRAIPERLCHG